MRREEIVQLDGATKRALEAGRSRLLVGAALFALAPGIEERARVRAPADRKADGRMPAPVSRRRLIRTLPPSPAATDPAAGLWAVALYSVAGLTLLRLAFLRVSPLELDVAEATRWLWSRAFAFGYAGEAPIPIWLTSVAVEKPAIPLSPEAATRLSRRRQVWQAQAP